MEYTVQKLGNLASISTRTLRYYDEIGILKPARINSSGYRIYGEKEVDMLQQILFFRELDVSLDSIKEILTNPSFNKANALREHREKLLKKRNQLDTLIANVDKTLAITGGEIKMSDKEKFEGFKKTIIDNNEKKYGKEIREKYGKDTIEKSNEKIMNMTEKQYDEVTQLEEQVTTSLAKAFENGDPASDIAQKTADLHKKWLLYYWSDYSKEAHAGIAQTYVDDIRFTAYYDKNQPGTAAFLRDAILIYTGMRKQ
ncbi:MerR family transcriptional regulator (plasmid) [Clostridium estertheticum]|uniref:MerR family transcriptional regulator n=1 Tax=Clostridium estertheticum TaxID=238834 RepID=UPI001C7DF0C7|nr:MerR family transcriptional regulator [Clostridium estertheticum]MBX4260408.1 MerR family transcriptional regulator [Clostridium estertheticum]WLC73010.1 MerR family transcriptional regulator [Clostridium estertheticum]